jgi:type IV pilus assembly protein PilF
MTKHLPIVLLPFFLGLGCALTRPIFGLSQDEKDRLERYLANAGDYYTRGRYPQAEQQYRKALEIDQKSIEANLGLAFSLLFQGSAAKMEEAEAQMTRVIDLDPKDFRGHFGLGNVHYSRARRIQDRLDHWKRQPPVAEPGRNLVQERTAERDRLLAAAAASYRKALELNRGYPNALSGLGQIAALRGDRDEALRHFHAYLDQAEATRRFLEDRRLRANDPETLDTVMQKLDGNRKKTLDMRQMIAVLLYEKGDYTGALDHLNRVIELEPERAREYLNRGQCHAKLGDYARAAADVETYLRKAKDAREPTLEEAHRLLTDYRARAAAAAVPAAKGGG